MIASPQLPPTRLSWMNTMIDSKKLIRGENASSMKLVAKIGMGAIGWLALSARCDLARRRVAHGRHEPAGAGRRRPRLRSCPAALSACEHSLGLDRIVSAVAPWVAPEQAPHCEHRAPKYAVLPDRLDRIARAGRLVLAAARDRRRDHPLIDDDRSRRKPAQGAHRRPR